MGHTCSSELSGGWCLGLADASGYCQRHRKLGHHMVSCLFTNDCVLAVIASFISPVYLKSFRLVSKQLFNFTASKYFRQLYIKKWSGITRFFLDCTSPITCYYSLSQDITPGDSSYIFLSFYIPAINLIKKTKLSIFIFKHGLSFSLDPYRLYYWIDRDSTGIYTVNERGRKLAQKTALEEIKELLVATGWNLDVINYSGAREHICQCLEQKGIKLDLSFR